MIETPHEQGPRWSMLATWIVWPNYNRYSSPNTYNPRFQRGAKIDINRHTRTIDVLIDQIPVYHLRR
jgi:hypothetical protein